MADNEYSPYLPSYDYFGPLMDGQQVVPPNKLVEPETRMQPDMLQAAMGLQPEAGTYIDELGRVYSKETNKLIPEARRPNVIPLTRNPNNELEFAMPRALDIVGNVMGGVVAPVKTADGAMIMGAGPIRKAAEAAGIRDAYQRTLSPLGLYSHGAEAAMSLPQAKGSPQQFKAMLEKAGVRPVEFENAGFDDAFAGKTSVTKDDVAKLFADKMPMLEEKVLGKKAPQLSANEINELNLLRNQDETKMALTDIQRMMVLERRQRGLEIDNPTKFQQYTLPGSENYREVLLKAPDIHTKMINDVEKQFEEVKTELSILRRNGKDNTEEYQQYSKMYDDLYKKRKELDSKKSNNYLSSHWDDPNVVAHVRMADRNVNGEKTLHVEELQSDWAQEGRKKGFKGSDDIDVKPLEQERERLRTELIAKESNFINQVSDGKYQTLNQILASRDKDMLQKFRIEKQNNQELQFLNKDLNDVETRISQSNYQNNSKLPSGPYVGNTQQWTDLALKRALKEAADGNYDRMVWTPGAEQAKRYNLSKRIDRLVYDPDKKVLTAYRDGFEAINKSAKPDELSDIVGKEVAKKLLETKPDNYGFHKLVDQQLSVGGEGMKSYYDKIVPTRLKEIVKRIDPEAKIEMVPIDKRNPESVTGKMVMAELPETRGTGSGFQQRFWEDLTQEERNELIANFRNKINKIEVPSIKMTPKLKEAIRKGLPAFSIGGAAALGVANSPNMRYNLKPVDHNPFEQKM